MITALLLGMVGAVSGVISGMGIGGGTILIPVLTIFFEYSQQQAQNANLIYFIPTAIIALITHFKEDTIEKQIAVKIILFGIVGAIVGSLIAIKIEPDILKKMFGFFLLAMGVMEFFKKDQDNQNAEKSG